MTTENKKVSLRSKPVRMADESLAAYEVRLSAYRQGKADERRRTRKSGLEDLLNSVSASIAMMRQTMATSDTWKSAFIKIGEDKVFLDYLIGLSESDLRSFLIKRHATLEDTAFVIRDMALTATSANHVSKLATSNTAGISREIWDTMRSQIRRPICHGVSHGHSVWAHSRGSMDVTLPEVSRNGEPRTVEDAPNGAYTPVRFIELTEDGPYTRIQIRGNTVKAISPFVCCRLDGTAKRPVGKATQITIPEMAAEKVTLRIGGKKVARYPVMSEITYDLWQRSNYQRTSARMNDGLETRADVIAKHQRMEAWRRIESYSRAMLARDAKHHGKWHWTMQARQTFTMFAANRGFSIMPAKTMVA